jgi:methanogenic corrinoid protein MtbC1
MTRRSLGAAPLVEALLDRDMDAVRRLTTRALAESGSRVDLVADHLHPALHAISEMWYQGAVRATREAEAAHIIAGILDDLKATPSAQPVASGSRFLLGSLEGEKHCLGMRTLHMALHDEGWEVAMSEPGRTADLAEMARLFKPQVVGMSCGYLPDFHRLALAVSDLKECGCRVMVGGAAMARASGLPTRVGAHATGMDARIAVVAARQQLAVWWRHVAMQERSHSAISGRAGKGSEWIATALSRRSMQRRERTAEVPTCSRADPYG